MPISPFLSVSFAESNFPTIVTRKRFSFTYAGSSSKVGQDCECEYSREMKKGFSSIVLGILTFNGGVRSNGRKDLMGPVQIGAGLKTGVFAPTEVR